MTRSSAVTSPKPSRRPPPVLYGMLLFPVVVCAALYAYYLLAQDVINPLPVQGVLKGVSCQGGSISKEGAKTSIVYLRTVYEFPSRSRDRPPPTKTGPSVDEITDYVEYDRAADCEAAAFALEMGSPRTVWAGENDLSDRFRARLTAERQYPPMALLWVPGCFAALVLWGWRRLASR